MHAPKLILASAIIALGMIGMMTVLRFLPGVVLAAITHWGSGMLIILLAGPMRLSLPDSWHRLRQCETSGTLYKHLGVPAYKKALLHSPLNNPWLRFEGRSGLAKLSQNTRNTELGHGLLFLISIPVIAFCFRIGQPGLGVWMILFNIPWNIYPVLVQRYNRSRLQRLRARHRLALNL
jgi:Glycosyl-4,4'-diaponeurosporenoate acyltransferase